MPSVTNRLLAPALTDSDYYLLETLRKCLENVITSRLNCRKEGTVLDFGCGQAPYRPLFRAVGLNYKAADLPGNPAVDMSIGPDGRLPCPDESFDVVLSTQVLEHVENVEAYLREAHRVLKPGGKLILSTHGWWTYHPYPPPDLWRWTRAGLHRTLQAGGFEPIQTYWLLGLLAYSFQLRVQCWKGLLDGKGPIRTALFRCISFVYQKLMALADTITPDEIGRDNAAVFVVVASSVER